MHDVYFPKVLVRLKRKHIQKPWITKGIDKSSKRKQKLYEKFLKHRTRETKQAYNSNKNLFESLKKKVKENITQKKYLNTNMMPKKMEYYEITNNEKYFLSSNLD